jgi:hypothetical protein
LRRWYGPSRRRATRFGAALRRSAYTSAVQRLGVVQPASEGFHPFRHASLAGSTAGSRPGPLPPGQDELRSPPLTLAWSHRAHSAQPSLRTHASYSAPASNASAQWKTCRVLCLLPSRRALPGNTPSRREVPRYSPREVPVILRPIPPPDGRGVGGGRSNQLLDALPNGFAHPIGLGEHLVVPETDNFKALAFQERGALGIMRHALGMLLAINLDGQHGIETDEIDDVRPNGFLPPKLPAEDLASAQVLPQQRLRFGGVVSHLTGTEVGHWRGGRSLAQTIIIIECAARLFDRPPPNPLPPGGGRLRYVMDLGRLPVIQHGRINVTYRPFVALVYV